MIRSDRGSHFANDLIKEFLDLTGAPHNLTLAHSSQENAIVERVNKEIDRHLKGLVFDTPSLVHYAKCIPLVQRIINSSVNKRTGFYLSWSLSILEYLTYRSRACTRMFII